MGLLTKALVYDAVVNNPNRNPTSAPPAPYYPPIGPSGRAYARRAAYLDGGYGYGRYGGPRDYYDGSRGYPSDREAPQVRVEVHQQPPQQGQGQQYNQGPQYQPQRGGEAQSYYSAGYDQAPRGQLQYDAPDGPPPRYQNAREGSEKK